jgi:hypothetical protein
MGLSRNEIEREARRVLRHMPDARLERRGAQYVLTVRPGGRARLKAAADTVAAFAVEGWIAAASDGRMALTGQGRAFVARDAATADPFRAQHGEVIELGSGVRQEQAVSALDALGRLKDEAGKPYLSDLDRMAAARLEADFERAHFRPRLTRDLEGQPLGDAGAVNADERLTVGALDARRRVVAALDAAGPGLKDLLFETVCLSRGLNEAEEALGWPRRAGKAVVRLGLQRLAEHYGLVSGARRPGRIEAWMEAVAGAG